MTVYRSQSRIFLVMMILVIIALWTFTTVYSHIRDNDIYNNPSTTAQFTLNMHEIEGNLMHISLDELKLKGDNTILITNICADIGLEIVEKVSRDKESRINIVGFDDLFPNSEYHSKVSNLKYLKRLQNVNYRTNNKLNIVDITIKNMCGDREYIQHIYNKYNFTHLVINVHPDINYNDVSCFNDYIMSANTIKHHLKAVIFSTLQSNAHNDHYNLIISRSKSYLQNVLYFVIYTHDYYQHEHEYDKKPYLLMNFMLNPSRISQISNTNISLGGMSDKVNASLGKYAGSNWNVSIVYRWYNSLMMNVNSSYDYDVVMFSSDILFDNCDIGQCNTHYDDIIFIDVSYDFVHKYGSHGLSPHDARIIFFYEFLKIHGSNYKYVMITDLFDVVFGRNPFVVIENRIRNAETDIIVGKENNNWHWYKWIKTEMLECYGWNIWSTIKTTHGFYNYGSGFCAAVDLSIEMFKLVIEELEKRPIKSNCAFAIFPWILEQMINKKRILDVTPVLWNSGFKRHHNAEKHKFVVYHK